MTDTHSIWIPHAEEKLLRPPSTTVAAIAASDIAIPSGNFAHFPANELPNSIDHHRHHTHLDLLCRLGLVATLASPPLAISSNRHY